MFLEAGHSDAGGMALIDSAPEKPADVCFKRRVHELPGGPFQATAATACGPSSTTLSVVCHLSSVVTKKLVFRLGLWTWLWFAGRHHDVESGLQAFWVFLDDEFSVFGKRFERAVGGGFRRLLQEVVCGVAGSQTGGEQSGGLSGSGKGHFRSVGRCGQ